MDEFTRDIEEMLRDIDAIVLENERLREAMIFSVRDWQIAYAISVLTLAVSSLVKKRQMAFKSPRLMHDEFLILSFLCGIMHSGVQVSQQSR